ncbi:SGS-domain-containing protein [Plenodomus tracheiphilus IPT5]|uniref:SGS-domain-containing protein n=1 Tax=Plenodomus tracheiphilus IPT5 TaxID=1408161 RepID=A0A6A7BBU0_9PLEO|nr:SGS-domain-containing protein [Plenodomus tracheiphilus IPT5]
MDKAAKGDAALSASKYDEAIQHYTDALSASPTAVKYYIGRSTAYQRSTKYTEALHDAETAVVLANKRAVRELIKEAQFRRAVALYHLGQYPDAQFVLDIVKGLDEKDKMLPIWSAKLAGKLKDMSPEDIASKVTIKKIPEVEVPSAASATKPNAPTKMEPIFANAAKPIVPTPVNKIKYDWYQNSDSVTVNILAKGVAKDSVTVDFEKDALFVSFPVSGSSSDYSYTADPLYASIDPTQSKYRVTANKVEITLRKATVGPKWHNLESDRKVASDEAPQSSIPSHVLSSKTNQPSGPVYPTSSKSGPKNWDTVVQADLDDKDEIEGDETSAFFKKLYSGASEEQQRAMMKSYSESGGTVLSTDWNDVGKKTVVPEPPEGMEARKY